MPENNPLGVLIAKAARADYEGRGRGKVVVDEWKVDGQPVTLYFRPLTMVEQFDIASYRRDDGMQYGMVRAIILKAEDELGNRLFTFDQERTFLQQASAAVVARISNAIMAGPSVEEAEKN